jgi:hypothetical protein
MSYLALLRGTQQSSRKEQWTRTTPASERENLYEPPWIRSRRDRLMDEAQADSDYWRSAVAQITGYVFPGGLARIPMREVYFQLGIPPSYKLTASKRIVPLMRSLGWTKRRIGREGTRQWVWEKFDLAATSNPPRNLAAKDKVPSPSESACPANPFIPRGRSP